MSTASGWVVSAHSQNFYAAYQVAGDDLAWERFEEGWANDAYAFNWGDVVTPIDATYFTVELTPKDREDFEEGWNSNESYVYGFAGVIAAYDTTPEDFEDFEEEWDSNENYLYAFVGPGVDLTVGSYDAGAPEDFEDFEDEWDSNESYVYTFSGTAALLAFLGFSAFLPNSRAAVRPDSRSRVKPKGRSLLLEAVSFAVFCRLTSDLRTLISGF